MVETTKPIRARVPIKTFASRNMMVRTRGPDHRHSGIILASAMRKLVVLLVGVLLLGIAIIAAPEQHLLPAYQLSKVSRGKAVTRVVAAGTVQPVVSVVVSSQVSGQVKEIFVDHNDEVKQGQPIALLAPDHFNTRVDPAQSGSASPGRGRFGSHRNPCANGRHSYRSQRRRWTDGCRQF